MPIPTALPPDAAPPEGMIAPEGAAPDMVDITIPKELLAQLASIFKIPDGQDNGESVSIQIPKADLDQLVEILSAASHKAGEDIEKQGQPADLTGLGDELSGMRDSMNR